MTKRGEGYFGEEHLFLAPTRTFTPRPVSKGGYIPPECHLEEVAPNIENEFDETVAMAESKATADNSTYYVLDLRVPYGHPTVSLMVKRFNARILSELSTTEVLVTSSVQDLKAAKNALARKTFKDNLFDIHPLRFKDIVDPDLQFKVGKAKAVTIYLVPNLGLEKAQQYIEQVKEQLLNSEVAQKTSFINSITGNAFLDAFVQQQQLRDLVDRFGFIFKAHETISVQRISPTCRIEPTSHLGHAYKANVPITDLPEVCILDTGVTAVDNLRPLITHRHVEPPNFDLDDFDNHGTSVASLAAYGDTIANPNPTPKARIISHKILEGQIGTNIVTALSNAIRMYPSCKSFNCSVNYTASKLGLKLATREINSLVQTSNVLVTFSAGNIDADDVESAITNGSRYPDYIMEAPVFHPSDALSVFSVGAYSKLDDASLSVAPADAPAPFTRFGTVLRELKNCPKPELAEHGGNLCIDRTLSVDQGRYNCNGVGINVTSNEGYTIEGNGTSFAAPLVSLHNARLWNQFANVRNAETIKALLLSTCQPTALHSKYVGLGIPNEQELFSSNFGKVRVVFEGSIPLKAPGLRDLPTDEFRLYVPADVSAIDLFLIHSDNYTLSPFPKLNTYLSVAVEKPGKGGSVDPSEGLAFSQTHVKHLVYRYKRNIKGDWFFKIVPHAIGISTAQREHVTVRYGAVIKLTTKKTRFGLGASVLAGLRRGREGSSAVEKRKENSASIK